MQYHAFLSYSHSDTNIMRRIRGDLSDAGLNVWTDESLVPGTASWKNAIEEAIQNTVTLVVLLSPDAKHSDWIEKEIDYARACNVKVLPILIRGTDEISAVPFELINVQRIDLRESYGIGIERLIETIKDSGDTDDFSPALLHSTPQAGASLEELNPVSFYDHVRLFVWLFWQPEKLAAYRNRYDDDKLQQTATWLVSDFAWITFLAPAVGIVLGTVQVPTTDPVLATVMQALSGVIFLGGWFVTGWFGWRKKPAFAMLLMVVTALIITGLFSAVFEFSGVVLSNGGGFTRPAFLILTGLMLSSAAGIAFRLAPSASGSVAGLLLGSLLFNAFHGVQLGLDGGVSALLMFVNTILISWVVDNSIKTGKRSIFHLIAVGTIGISGTLMIVLYFLGGWIFLMNINPA